MNELYVQLRRIALQQSAVNAVLPIVTFVNVYHADGRLWSVSLVSWVVAALLGAFGYCAAEARSSTLVTAYVCFGVLGGGALAAVQVAVDWTMSAACEVTQSAYKECHECQCLFTDSCSQDDLDNDEGCDDCKAFSTDICDALGFESSGADRLVNGFTALVTLLASCVPVGVAILLLIRKEQEDATVAARFSWIKGQILDQCMLLESGYKPTIDGPPLLRLIRACEEHDPALAERAKSLVAMWEAHGGAAGWLRTKAQEMAETSLEPVPPPEEGGATPA